MNPKVNTINMRVSQQTNAKYDYIIGFDLGALGLRCSYLRRGDEEPRHMSFSAVSYCSEHTLPAIVFYKDWQRGEEAGKVSVGFEARERRQEQSEADFCIINVKGYIFDLLSNSQMDGPSKERVSVDFFTALLQMITVATESAIKASNIDKCRYSFTIPDGFQHASEYAGLIRYAFIMAGFLTADDDEEEDRLLFVHDAVAAGHACLVDPRKHDKVWPIQNYLVCDIGSSFIKLSLVNREATDAMSEIRSLGSIETAAYHKFARKSKANINTSNISKRVSKRSLISKFIKDALHSAKSGIELYDVHKLAGMTAALIKPLCFENNVDVLYFCGKHCNQYPLSETAMASHFGSCKIVASQDVHTVSLGATLFALKTKLNQIPVFKSEVVSAREKHTTLLEGNECAALEDNLPFGSCVVGIDFGTAFSGASYANISHYTKDIKQPSIKAITEWCINQPYPKMPAALTYDNLVRSIEDARYDHDLGDKSLLGDKAIMLCYKLLLLNPPFTSYFGKSREKELNDYVERRYRENHEAPLLDMITAHFKLLCETIITTIASNERSNLNDLSLRYVIAVPVLFTRAARNLLMVAVAKAGLVSQSQLDLVQFITEPEATVLGCEDLISDIFGDMSSADQQTLAFIVCDLGGGTVDFSTMQRITKNGAHQMQQLGDSTSELCGAIHLNRKFRQYMDYLDDKYLCHTTFTFYDILEQYFDATIKRGFHPEHEDYVIPYNFSRHLPYENSRYFNGTNLIIPALELKERVFDPVLERVFRLFDDHIEKFSNVPLDALFLVGGLAGCPYVQSEIKRYCRQKGITRVIVPTNYATVVSEGAVAYYLNPHLIAARALHVSYAIQTKATLNHKDVSCMTYFAQQGTLLDAQDKISEKLVSITYPSTTVIGIFTTTDRMQADTSHVAMNDLSSSLNFRKMDELIIELPPSSVRLGTKILFKLTFKLSIDGVAITVKCLNEHLGLKELQYESMHSFGRFERRIEDVGGNADDNDSSRRIDEILKKGKMRGIRLLSKLFLGI